LDVGGIRQPVRVVGENPSFTAIRWPAAARHVA
jgi:hypothetical protein